MLSIIKISPEFKYRLWMPSSYARIKFCYKTKKVFTTQRRWRQILYFCMIIAARLIPVNVIWRFMSHIVNRKTENHKKLFIVKFHQNLRKRSSLEMVRFFLRSVYNKVSRLSVIIIFCRERTNVYIPNRNFITNLAKSIIFIKFGTGNSETPWKGTITYLKR